MSLTASDPTSNREYYIDTKTGQSHWQIPDHPTPPTGDHPNLAFHSDNVIPTQNPGEMGDAETGERGFASDMAMNMVKSKMSGGKSSQPPPGPLDQVGNLLSSVLGGGNSQSAPPPSKTSSGVGGMVSSLLSGKHNTTTNQSSQNTSTSQQGTTDFGGMITSFLGGGNQTTTQPTQNTSKPQQGGTDYVGMVSSFLGGGNQNFSAQMSALFCR